MERNQKPVVSISMLVSNHRRDTIEKCMASLVPLMETVPSELIVVDTGCIDGSIDVARRYADKVISFTWCNDFSAARNIGLKECSGEWFLYLDDDEWFEDVSELVSFLQGDEKEHYDALFYIQRNYGDLRGESYTDAYVGRMVKRTEETRFCGKIHEWLEPIPRRVKRIKDYVHHYGYVFRNEEDKRKHAQRNIILVEQAVKENPDDIRMCCQLVQEYRITKRYEEALTVCKRTLENTSFSRNNPFVQYLLLAVPRIYREQGDYEKALTEFDWLEEADVFLPQIRPAMLHEKATALVGLRNEPELQKVCRQYLRELDSLTTEDDWVMDLAGFASSFVRQKVAEYGIMSVFRSKDTTYAMEFFDVVEWDGNKYELVIALLQCYVDSGDSRLLHRYLPRVLAVPELKELACGTLDSMCERRPDRREKITADLELIVLAEQLKSATKTQLAEGKVEEAKAILSELAMMLPEDEEVKKMLENI